MRIVYFTASQFDYGKVIYPGVGARFGNALGWEVASVAQLAGTEFDTAVVDPRVQPEDIPYLEDYLSRPAARRAPLFFKITDPETPLSKNPAQRYTFEQADRAGVHYATAYEPAGPLQEFFEGLSVSIVAPLPFPYDTQREIDIPMDGRKRKVLLTGEQWRRIYPLRHKALMTWKWNPLGRLAMDVLRHPGYPDAGTKPTHNITHDRFVAKLGEYKLALMCPSVFGVELMKYVECAYAGCVPIGEAPRSISEEVCDSIVNWKGGGAALLKAASMDDAEASQRAMAYRSAMKRLREPGRVTAAFKEVASRVA